MIAQGNAIGLMVKKILSPVRAKREVLIRVRRQFSLVQAQGICAKRMPMKPRSL